MAKRIVLVVLGALVIGLLMTTVALAATPKQIYDDYAYDGILDGHYTKAELLAYLNDSTVAQYASASVKGPLDTLVKKMLTRDTFPFTGFQLMIAGIVAVALVGGGIALRRFSRPQKS